MFSCEFVQVNSVPTFLRVNECFFRSAEQEIGLTMQCTVWIVAESSIRDIFFTELCKEDCMHHLREPYHTNSGS